MTVPAELYYTAEHEWIAIAGSTASVGITDHAQRALGDVVFVSVPAAGSHVTEVKPEIDDDPGLVNSDPYGAGWLFKVQIDESDRDIPPGLLTAVEYMALTQEDE